MGNPKQKWKAEEEEALRKGVLKHGAGKWQNILKDPDFSTCLSSRNNIDLKDKWRNLSVANGQIRREKSSKLKIKARLDAPATPLLLTQAPASIALVSNDASANGVKEVSGKCKADVEISSKYNAMIFEAVSSLKDPNGSDINLIASFIRGRHEVPRNFKRFLSGKLGKLVVEGRLEKAPNGYRITGHMPKVEAPDPKPRDIVHHPRLPQTIGSYLCETVEDAAVAAAYKVAEAENKKFVAAEAMKEAERVAEMAEDAESFLQLAIEIYNRCTCNEIVVMA